MSNVAYQQQTTGSITVPATKWTEPSVWEISAAVKMRNERQQQFNRDRLRRDQQENYLESIAEEIKLRAGLFKRQTFEIGRLLTEVKKLLPHGEFDQWVKEHVGFSKGTAVNCMRVFKVCMGHPWVVDHFSSSALYVIVRPSFPEELRQFLFDRAEEAGGVFNINDLDILKTATQFKNGEVTLSSPEVQGLMKNEQRASILKRYLTKAKQTKAMLEHQLKKIEEIGSKPVVNNPLIEEQEDATEARVSKLILYHERAISKLDTWMINTELDLKAKV